MNELLKCWADLMSGIGWLVATFWPIAAVYAVLYAIGAFFVLRSLRTQSVDGKLQVDTTSLLYKIAHPYRFGQLREDNNSYTQLRAEVWKGKSNICAVYAAAFNMLLFVWPVLLVYFAVAAGVGSVVAFLTAGAYIVPDLSNDGFVRIEHLWEWENPLHSPALYVVVAAMIIAATLKGTALLHFLGVVGWVALCMSPVWLVLGVGLYVVRRIGKDKDRAGTSVNLMTEVLMAKKGRYCKTVEIK